MTSTKTRFKAAALLIWGTITFLALICEAETFLAFLAVKVFGFVSAVLIIHIVRNMERSGEIRFEDDSTIFL